ncbi:hypothetical protein I4U23_025105 [Adineta vaga]|nr:hypothetical protein I4U23_025105 [Adineta vaga]
MSEQEKRELLEDKDKLFEYLSENLEEIEQTLDSEAQFIDKDVANSIEYIEQIKTKFLEKIEEFTMKLQDFHQQSTVLSEENKALLQSSSKKIDELYESGKYDEALEEFQSYRKSHKERQRIHHAIPKLHCNEEDIDQFFSSNLRSNQSSIQSRNLPASVLSPRTIDIDDEQDEGNISEKQKSRRNMEIENNDSDQEDTINTKEEQELQKETFGSRLKQISNKPQSTPTPPPSTNTVVKSDNQSSTSTTSTTDTQRKYLFSTRLATKSDNTNQSASNRNPSNSTPTQNIHITAPNNHEQIRSASNSTSSPIRPLTSPNQNDQFQPLTFNPVVLYKLEDNRFLLMTCAGQDIVLFKCQRNQLHRWSFAKIERYTHDVRELPWHEGLIISMGSIDKFTIYMFTEREFLTYFVRPGRRGISRILPRGNDDGSDLNNYSYNFSQRGIGTVYDKHMYHLYLNRNCHWTLSTYLLKTVANLYDYDLNIVFPDVERFIQFCVNEKTIHFLVQMWDSSYAVVFCSVNNCNTNDCSSPVILTGAHEPLTICCVPNRSTNQYHFYINDPVINVLHVIDSDRYLYKHSIKAHAICYVSDRNELMVVTENSICSININ